MDVHPTKNGMYRYWSIAIWSCEHGRVWSAKTNQSLSVCVAVYHHSTIAIFRLPEATNLPSISPCSCDNSTDLDEQHVDYGHPTIIGESSFIGTWMDMNGHMDMTISSISTKAPFQPDRLHIQWRAKNLWPRSSQIGWFWMENPKFFAILKNIYNYTYIYI